ncbi:MAG TPA: molybdopterin oxidoreductase family protein, partial [Chromatiales bacterium]|nr:molybdopterin oxidoreductase family protein [Chromatiales bacterium]
MNRMIRRSVCPYDCPDTCGLLVEVEGEQVVKVSGDPEHPFTRGFLCPKMQHYERTVHSPRRLTTPLLRRGAKGSGDFEPITWDEAIERIVDRWQAIIAAHGGEAILPYSYGGTLGLVQRNAGHPFFHALGASRLARTICSPAKGAGWQAIMGDTMVPPPDEVVQSDLVILWGVNAAATNIHYLPFVQQARRRGASVWLIDTYRTPTAAGVDRVMLLRPGSDGALALAMMHVLAREGLVDHEFVAAQVQGYEAFAAEVLPACTPIWASGRTGLPAALIEELARAYAGAQAPCIRLGSGLSRYGNGAMTVRTIAALPALVGAYGKIGGGCFPSTSTSAAFAAAELTREDLLAAPTRLINMNQLGHALTELQAPPIQSLYVYHANPAAATPDQNAVLRGLAREDLFTVVHERFLTDTARYADIVLPATSSVEHSDLYRSYCTYVIQRARPCIPPVGESRSNREVFTLLARALGFDEEIYRRSAEELIDHLLSLPSPLRGGI